MEFTKIKVEINDLEKKKKNLNYKSKSLVYEKGNLIKCKTANSTVKKKKKKECRNTELEWCTCKLS